MAGKTDAHSDSVLNVLRSGTISTITPYIGLLSAAPSDTAGGTELTAGGYARQAVTFGAPSGGSPRVIANTAAVTFGPATGSDWPSATHFGVYTASTAGTLLYWVALPTAKTVQVGDTGAFAIGALTISED
jgi:hypothetical protein